MTPPSQPPADLLTAYRHGLLNHYVHQTGVLAARLESFPEAAQHRPLAPEEWSPHQVIWHVHAVEMQAYLPRLVRLLEASEPLLADFDGEAWMAEQYTSSESCASIVARVREARQEMRSRLEQAPVAAWARTGFHSYWGTRTVMWWVERSIGHVDEHARQLKGGSSASPTT
ncbi:MAG: hypothetical protein A2Z17_04900 [Gammaproteobacteria bacterium RBG_16_66_13]|nr:MAG: hypothetical protein A2Z17_04900 [Gammaproteobacteria bacterium RBG_16_66_13]